MTEVQRRVTSALIRLGTCALAMDLAVSCQPGRPTDVTGSRAEAALSSVAALPCSGGICEDTIAPLAIDPTLVDVGPGHKHYVCRPDISGGPTAFNGKVVVHLTGSNGNPADKHGAGRAACEAGFAAVVPAYQDDVVELEGICDTAATPLTCPDDIHEQALFQRLAGSPYNSGITTPNAIRQRLLGVLGYLATTDSGAAGGGDFRARWNAFKTKLNSNIMDSAIVTGSSRGAGHATYWATKYQFNRLIAFSGPGERYINGATNLPSDWIAHYSGSGTPANKMLLAEHEDDTVAVYTTMVKLNLDTLGAGKTECNYDHTLTLSQWLSTRSSCRRVLFRHATYPCPGGKAHGVTSRDYWKGQCDSASASDPGVRNNKPMFKFLMTVSLP